MGVTINKKAVYTARYQKGTVIELLEPIADPYSPKPAGARFEVDYVDDMLQLHGRWLSPESGNMAVMIEQDKFQIVT